MDIFIKMTYNIFFCLYFNCAVKHTQCVNGIFVPGILKKNVN